MIEPSSTYVEDRYPSEHWKGWAGFGAILMMIAGGFKLLSGIIGLFRGQFLLHGYNGYAIVNVRGLAVWWLIIGALLLAGGMASMGGRRWGHITGIVAASLAAISEFFMIPYYPIWSIMLVVMYVIILLAFVRAPSRAD